MVSQAPSFSSDPGLACACTPTGAVGEGPSPHWRSLTPPGLPARRGVSGIRAPHPAPSISAVMGTVPCFMVLEVAVSNKARVWGSNLRFVLGSNCALGQVT